MSAKFLALAVLVQLYGVGQTANLEHVQDSISYKAVQTDGTSKNARLDEMTLELFTWTYSSSDSRTSLTVCTAESFGGIGQTVQQVTLLITINGEPEKNCEGVFDEDGKKCSTFTETDNCPVAIPSGDVQYTLMIFVTTITATKVDNIGTASFTMTVEAATLKCGDTLFIRATGITGANNIDTCEAQGVHNVCYKTGDLKVDPFCFTATVSEPAELILCLKGDNQYVQAPDGDLTITQLTYDTPTGGSATFSLTRGGSDSTAFEALVLKNKTPLQSCDVTPVAESSGTCTISDFTGDHAEYNVCTIIPALSSFQTAHSSITDLDFQAEEGANALQFRFTNANPDKKYVAKLDNYPSGIDPPTVDIDCTGVTQGHICYGFMEKSISNTFLTVEYLDADEITSNKIAIPNPGFPRL